MFPSKITYITDKMLYQDLKYVFGLSLYELNDILIPWLEEKYNLHVERVVYSGLH